MTASLEREIDDAIAARARLGARPVAETAAALAEAARRWRDDPALVPALHEAADLSLAMLREVLPLVAEPFDAGAMCELHAREGGRGTPPVLVAASVASNVPALALPTIAHACLAGAAIVVKSGRNDAVSASAFRRALAAVDPALAATIVATTWPGGAPEAEAAVLARADVVVATGTDATVAALATRHGTKVLAYGDRTSLAVLAADATDDEIAALAWDVARYEQRGCLSPHVLLVMGDDVRRTAERLAAALDVVARELPAPALSIERRAARRLVLEHARFAGATVLEVAGGAVVIDPDGRADDTAGDRTIRVRSVRDAAAVVDAVARGTIECVGVGRGVGLDVEALRARGVARICPVGRMQRPRLDWPRGQRPALASLFRVAGEPRIQVES